MFRKVRDTAALKLNRGQTRKGWVRRQGKENRHSPQSFSRTLLHLFSRMTSVQLSCGSFDL